MSALLVCSPIMSSCITPVLCLMYCNIVCFAALQESTALMHCQWAWLDALPLSSTAIDHCLKLAAIYHSWLMLRPSCPQS